MNLLYEDKSKLVKKVFNKVYDKYDLMNDIMSLGTHRIWKKKLVSWINPKKNNKIIDVASGTGDIAKLCSQNTNNNCEIVCVEPNEKMLQKGKNKLRNFNNIKWKMSSAEHLPFEDETFDYYTISFGIRNVTNLNKSLNEAYRVLKNGGRFFCLEFSKVENEILKIIYQNYSKLIPSVGKFVAGDDMPYKYLIQSIEKFYNQEDFSNKILNAGFANVEYRNLTNGIAAIHTGWKIE
jgi:demethylmenaquinone methyltransferase/2-methoxy-6-polyprenyl-1,4-benzoquinol methylase